MILESSNLGLDREPPVRAYKDLDSINDVAIHPALKPPRFGKPPSRRRSKQRGCGYSEKEIAAMARNAKVIGEKEGVIVSFDPETNVHLIESSSGETLAYVLPDGDFRDFSRPLTTKEKQVVRSIIEEKTGERKKKNGFPWLLAAGGAALYFMSKG